MNLGIFTIAYNGYGRFAERWCTAISKMTLPPSQVVLALFGENHGLSEEDAVWCQNRLTDIPFKIVHAGAHITMGADRNKAIAALETEWVMLLSIDDFIFPNAVEEFEKHANPDVDVIACSYIHRRRSGDGLNIVRPPQDLSKERLLNWRASWVPPYSPFRRSVWEQHPYRDTDYPNIPFVFDLARARARFARSEVPVVLYNVRKDSHCGRRTKIAQLAINRMLDQYAREEKVEIRPWQQEALKMQGR